MLGSGVERAFGARAVAILALGTLGCADEPEKETPRRDVERTEWESGVVVETWTDTSDGDGYVRVAIDVDAGDVFQVTVRRDRGALSTDYVVAPDGTNALDWNDWYESSYSLTDSIFPSPQQNTVDWPVRAEDGPLAAGTWEVAVATLDSNWEYQGGAEVAIEVLRRPEPDASAGSLRAVVAYAGGLQDDDEVVRGTEGAVAYWKQLYASWGVTLAVEYATIDLEADLPAAWTAQEEVEALLAGMGGRAALVVIGDTVEGDAWLYGEAAGIPGPYAATPRSVVEIGWLANAGADAEFDDADVLLMGETIAHEVGHYMGLYHPVEDGWEYWDAIDDTEACQAMTACEAGLGENLMFPYPLCYGARCSRQDKLSGGQVGVVQRWIGVEG